MYKKITVAYNETPEAGRALFSAIQLANDLGAELRVVTVIPDQPRYAAFAAAGDPSLPQTLEDDRLKFYHALQEKAVRSRMTTALKSQASSPRVTRSKPSFMISANKERTF
jgi:hypothetical protein